MVYLGNEMFSNSLVRFMLIMGNFMLYKVKMLKFQKVCIKLRHFQDHQMFTVLVLNFEKLCQLLVLEKSYYIILNFHFQAIHFDFLLFLVRCNLCLFLEDFKYQYYVLFTYVNIIDFFI